MFKGLHEDNDNKVILHGKIHWCNIYKYKHCKSHFNIMISDDLKPRHIHVHARDPTPTLI